MRLSILILAVALSACVAGPTSPPGVSTTLTPADASTSLMTGGPLTMVVRSRAAAQGDDPLVLMTLRASDGRSMSFEASNHTPNDVMAQAAGGPLAQAMGLQAGDEAPVLYATRASETSGAPIICGPAGPANVGYYEAADGTVSIIGMKQNFEFETRPDGTQSALPFSPDLVCARLRFRKG